MSVLLLLAFFPSARAVWLEWDPNVETNVAGYRVYVGTQSRAYSSVTDAGKLTLFQVAALQPGATYFFAVTAYDTDGLESEYSDEVSWTVPQPNLAPLANADRYKMAYATVLSVGTAQGVLSNDWDPEGNVLSAMLMTGPAHGLLTLSSNGAFSYTPAQNFYGLDSFRYAATDGKATSIVAVVTIEVAGPSGGTTLPAAPPFVELFASSDGTWLEWEPSSAPGVTGYRVYWGRQSRTYDSVVDGGLTSGCQVTNLLAGTTYYFSVTAYDADGLESAYSMEVSYTTPRKNRAPQARPEHFQTRQQSAISISAAQGLLSNDSDPDGDELLAVLSAPPQHGVLTLAGNGGFSYVPAPDFQGIDSFQYVVTDGVTTSAVCVVTIEVIEQPAGTPSCTDCFAELDRLLESKPEEFSGLIAARNTATKGDCIESGVATFTAVARAAGNIDSEQVATALKSAFDCLADNIALAAAERDASMKSIPSSKWTQSARTKSAAIVPAIEAGKSSRELAAKGKSLATALAALKRVDQLMLQAELAPASLSNRVFACAMTLGTAKVNRTLSFNVDHFVSLAEDGTPVSAGSYIFTRTGWNTGTLILLSESGDLTILELSFSRGRGRIGGPHARGVFKMQ